MIVTGYADWTTREIVIEREIIGTLEDMECYIRKVKRHEIVHAFLFECGLHECSGNTEAWAMMKQWSIGSPEQGQRYMKLGKQPELFESGVFDLPGAFYMDFCIMENNVNIQIPKNQAIICICRQWDVTNTLLTNYKITFFTILY